MTEPALEHRAEIDVSRRAPAAGRLRRLAVKELKETLRDRRTLVTLVLMPFLLYPLLSMVLRKFLLAGAMVNVVPTYHVGFDSDHHAALFGQLLEEARNILASRPRPDPMPTMLPYSTPDVEQALRQRDIDVALRVTRPPPKQFTPGQNWEADVELLVLEGSLNSERAARLVEDCLRVYGNRVVANQLQAAGIRQRASPVRTTQKKIVSTERAGSVSLPALVPFVLILMTITGAVYPAIDLTAGERERGTLELLIAAPVPRLALLFAKFVAVLTVAVMTATVNVLAMTGTVALSGLGPLLWGDQGLSLETIAASFFLLILLAGFFAAVLLAITSFARSFKEAQAYLIPVMLCALGPGVVSLMPGVELSAWLAVTPLLNVALLSRDLLNGTASIGVGIVVVLSTAAYAFAALLLAARLFAADAVLYDARLGWSEVWRRPQAGGSPGIGLAMFCLACMYPVSFAAQGTIMKQTQWGIDDKLLAATVATALVFGGVPLIFGYWRRIAWDNGFQWRLPPALSWTGAALLGCSLWPFAHEITLATRKLGIMSLDAEQVARAKAVIEQSRTVPVGLVLLAIAVAPAIFEEFCFRGFVFSALRSKFTPWKAILASGGLFGIFHLIAADSLPIERLVPSTLLGIILGWVCYRTGSVFPGMLVHLFHNGLLALMFYYLPDIIAAGWGVEETEHMPLTWLAAAAAVAGTGFGLLQLLPRPRQVPGVPDDV